MKDYNQTIKDLEELREYINNVITDAQTVCRKHDNEEQVNNTLYGLADAAKDLIITCGYHIK